MAQIADSSTSSDQPALGIPYPRSWADSLVDWIRAVPGPAWLFYVATLLGVALLNHVIFWLDGSLEPGAFHMIRFFNAIFVVYPIALYHYLKVVAGRFSRLSPCSESPRL